MASLLEEPILSVLDDATLLVLTRGLLPVAARRHGAARRRLWRRRRRKNAADRTRRLRRASRASSAALAVMHRARFAHLLAWPA